MTNPATCDVVTVTLNPAIDQTLEISNFVAGEMHRVQNVTSVAGGKGVNVAAALADFGLRVAATGFIGRDNESLFTELFARKNIQDKLIRLEGSTRTGIKIADATRGLTTDINFPGLTPTPQELETLEKSLLDLDAPWVVLAGSLPPRIEVSLYSQLTKKLRAQGRQIAFDSSGEALKTLVCGEAKSLPHLIKPNISELEDLLEANLTTRRDVLLAARSLVKRGIDTVIVSMGAEGALFVTRDAAIFAVAQAPKVVTTVGAGDAMVAGFVASQLRARPLEPSAKMATAFSLDALASLEAGISSPENIQKLVFSVTTNREM